MNMKRSLISLAFAAAVFGQQPNFRLPDETAGLNNIVNTLITAFDHVDIVALGEEHGRKFDSDLRIGLVRHPDFAKKVRFIVVEFARIEQQAILDRYIRGDNVPVTQTGVWDSPVYADFFAAVREVNSTLPDEARIRVFATDLEFSAVSILKEQVLKKQGKALLIYGAAHLFRTDGNIGFLSAVGGGITRKLEADHPGQTFVVITIGEPRAGYEKLQSALKTPVRPVLVSLERPPFRAFTAEEFIGSKLVNMANGHPVSVFQGSGLTLGALADACVYSGDASDTDTRAVPN